MIEITKIEPAFSLTASSEQTIPHEVIPRLGKQTPESGAVIKYHGIDEQRAVDSHKRLEQHNLEFRRLSVLFALQQLV